MLRNARLHRFVVWRIMRETRLGSCDWIEFEPSFSKLPSNVSSGLPWDQVSRQRRQFSAIIINWKTPPNFLRNGTVLSNLRNILAFFDFVSISNFARFPRSLFIFCGSQQFSFLRTHYCYFLREKSSNILQLLLAEWKMHIGTPIHDSTASPATVRNWLWCSAQQCTLSAESLAMRWMRDYQRFIIY